MTEKVNPRDRSRTAPQGDDAAFLVDEFDMGEEEAAEAVKRDGVTADEVKDAARRSRQENKPLDDLPTPASGPDHVADSDEVRLKPVLNTANERSGGG